MPELQPKLGYAAIISLAIGSIVGTGIFFGTAIGAHYAGNMVIIAWALLSVVALYISACFGELTSMFPRAGGIYEFSKRTYGRFFSFVLGWLAWLVGSLSATVMIIAAVNSLPLTQVLGDNVAIGRIVLSIVLILLINLIALIGLEMTSVALVAFAAVTILVVTSVIGIGLPFFDFGNFSGILLDASPFANIAAISLAMFFLAETFFGWEGATYLAEETRDPTRVIPKSLVIGTAAVVAMGFITSLMLLGTIGHDNLSQAVPLGGLLSQPIPGIAKAAIAIGVFITMLGAAAASIITMPRLLMALARDRLMLDQFKSLHERFNTPHKAIAFQTALLITLLFIGLGKYQLMLSLLVPLALIMYSAVLLIVPILRHRMPGERPFNAPIGSIGPVAVVILFLSMLVLWTFSVPAAGDQLKLSLSLVLIGIPLYLLVELYYDPKMITSVNDVFSYLNLITERISIPRGIINEVIVLLGDVKGKTVLEFGTGVGTLTVNLMKAVGSRGMVIATHFSRNDLKIMQKRIMVMNWEAEEEVYGKVKAIHDIHALTRVHPEIKYADAAVSIGMLSYLQDVKKVLREIREILPDDGRICFVEFTDYFHVIPNPEWLSRNETIEKVFREAGFSVQVMRKKGPFWNYTFIYGIKYGQDVPYI